MHDTPPEPARNWLLKPEQAFPPDEQRRAAWQGEFAQAGAFRGAFEHAAIGMAIVDLDGRFLKVNRSLCRIVGYGEEELLATDFQSITHPDDLDSDLELTRNLMAGAIDHFQMEKRYIHRDGGIVWIQLSASVVRDDGGQPYYAVAQIQDISARKQAELESVRRLRQLERLTQTVPRVLQALETGNNERVYRAVLRVMLDAFSSPVGMFLRVGEDGELQGTYLSETEATNVRYPAAQRNETWNAALSADNVSLENVIVDNGPRAMARGRIVARSLIAAIIHNDSPLGLFHIGDAPCDYDPDDGDLLAVVSKMIAPVLHARTKHGKLTPREGEVMDLIVAGMTQKQIATALTISVQTAAKHRAKVLDKLNVRNDVELVRLALQMRPQGVY